MRYLTPGMEANGLWAMARPCTRALNKCRFTRAQKNLIRAYTIKRERARHEDITQVRLLASGDVRAYCKDGCTYLVAPTAELFAEATNRRTTAAFAG
jgi:hypothetical protein